MNIDNQNFNVSFFNFFKPQFICVVVAILIAFFSLFIVQETETVFIVRFGKVVRQVDKAGLYFRTPLLDSIASFDKRILQVYSPAKEIIASDQKRLIVDAYAKYKITNTKAFYESLRNEHGANLRVSSMLDSIMRQIVAQYPLSS